MCGSTSGDGDQSQPQRLELAATVEHYLQEKLEQGYVMAPISWECAARVEQLLWHHRDPFDRLLAAHALTEKWPIVTRDRVFRKYGVDVIW